MKKSQLFLIGFVIFGFELRASHYVAQVVASDDVYAWDEHGNWALKSKSLDDRVREAIVTNNEDLLKASLCNSVQIGENEVDLARKSGSSQTMIENLQGKKTGFPPLFSGLFARSHRSVSPVFENIARIQQGRKASPCSSSALFSRLSPMPRKDAVIHPEISTSQNIADQSDEDSY